MLDDFFRVESVNQLMLMANDNTVVSTMDDELEVSFNLALVLGIPTACTIGSDALDIRL